jgi:ribosomal protein S18 acetylase RimI-like enzyme
MFEISQANKDDISHIIETIIESEKSGTSTLSYIRIFNISEDEIRFILTRILLEESFDSELSLSSFYIARKNNKFAGCISAWEERKHGLASSFIKANLLREHLSSAALSFSKRYQQYLMDLHLPYEANQIIIGLVYVSNDFRGMGLVQDLINYIQAKLIPKNNPKSIYIQLFDSNIAALKSYQKSGFEEIKKVSSLLYSPLEVLPSSTKIMLRKTIK